MCFRGRSKCKVHYSNQNIALSAKCYIHSVYLHTQQKSITSNTTTNINTNVTHTHSRLTALFLGLPGWASTRKVKPIWILLKQETVCGSGISWAICKSASRSRQITMPVPHHSSFLQAGCPSWRPTNSIKALKANTNVKTLKMRLLWSSKHW